MENRLDDPMQLLQPAYVEVGAAIVGVLLVMGDIDEVMPSTKGKEDEQERLITSPILQRRINSLSGGSGSSKKVLDEERIVQEQAGRLDEALRVVSSALARTASGGPGGQLVVDMGIEKLYECESLLCILALQIVEQAQVDDGVGARAVEGGRALPAVTECQKIVQHERFWRLVGEGEGSIADGAITIEKYTNIIWAMIKQCDVDTNREGFAWRNSETVLDKTLCQVVMEGPIFNGLFGEIKKSYYESLKPPPVINWNAAWWAKDAAEKADDRRVECVGCCDTLLEKECLKAECEHYFCEGCVVTLVSITIKDEACFPMKCCKRPMKQADISTILEKGLRELYASACMEFGTPAEDRVYCPRPKCSAFLGSLRGRGQTISCDLCRLDVCLSCKESAHLGENCEENEALNRTRKLAEEQQWRACPKCKAIVDKTGGCNHMVCRCTQEFCYRCGVPWRPRTCSC